MAFVMAIRSEIAAECVEETRIEVRREVFRLVLVCPGFFGFALRVLMGLL